MKKYKIIYRSIALFAFCCFAISGNCGQASDTTKMPTACFSCQRPDGHGPIGVMTDHIHPKGEWSIAYSYMNMQMAGNMSGTQKVSDDQMFNTYMMAPNKMTMQMHMLMGMYGVTSKLTLMGMLNYISNNMSMNMMPMSEMQMMMMNMPGMNMGSNPSMPSSSKSSGLGDSKLYALYNLLNSCDHRLIIGAGVSIPTGDINVKGTTMLGDDQQLAYPMQLGSGTFDILPSITYSGISENFSWGGAVGGNIKTTTNSAGYALGNSYNATAWLAYKCCNWLSCSARIEGISTGTIYGSDPQIALLAYNDPSANAANYGGKLANALIGINIFKPSGMLKGTRFLAEYAIPVYQNLNGPQMAFHNSVQIGIQYNFK